MKCARCGRESAPAAKFCEECGAPLARTCAHCGVRLSASANFCPECGQPADPERFLGSAAALEGERKHVTVLFADMKSSMEMLAARDPEVARTILDPVLDLMMEAVHRYEGTVNQVMGDGIMALFGAPVSQEDHAVRACYAALRMQDRVQRYAGEVRRTHAFGIQIRVGLNSGDVVVRSIGSDFHMDYTAVGQTTHLAARMEQMAEPGTILATADTLRLAGGFVQATPLGRVPVKGLETPVEVHTVTGVGAVRSALEAAASRGLTRFVGRDAEVLQLERALALAARGHGQVVGVVGEPGVGKSRLFHEFTNPDRMRGWRMLGTSAASYNRRTPYVPIIGLLRSCFDLHGRDTAGEVQEQVIRRARAMDTALGSAVPALCALLDAPVEDREWDALDARRRRQQTMDAVTRVFLTLSRHEPVSIVVEDLHWIDSETQAVLDRLVDAVPTARLLLLLNYRPEYRHRWASKSYYTQLRIDPLARDNASALLDALLGAAPDLEPLKQLLIARTEGNPFFCEEIVRTFADSGVLVGAPGAYRVAWPVETVQVPGTVQAVLAARIDALRPDDKRLLQSAAVIGEKGRLALLEAVAEVPPDALPHALERLRARELLYDTSPFPDPEYIFKHGLTCVVAYSSVLQDRRRALHARVVEAIQRLYPDRLQEHVERLAHHALRGELWQDAVRFAREAGNRAYGRSANTEAVAWFTRALQVLARLPETADTELQALDLHLALRNPLTLLGDHERTLLELRRVQELAERVNDRRRLGRALSFEVNALFLLGHHREAVDSAHRARAVADELQDRAFRTATDLYAGRAHFYLGELDRAIDIFSEIVRSLSGPQVHEQLGLPTLPAVFARSLLAECLAHVGRFAEGADRAREAVALAESTRHPDTMLWAYHGAGVHHLVRREVAQATAALDRAHAICRTHDMPAYVSRVSAELGFAWALGGRVDDALVLLRRAVDAAAARKQATSYSQALLLLGEAALVGGRLDEAVEATRAALEHFRQRDERGHEAWALRVLADLAAARAPADLAEAEQAYRAAIALASRLGMHPLRARAELGLARVLRRQDSAEEAATLVAQACDTFRATGMAADLASATAAVDASA